MAIERKKAGQSISRVVWITEDLAEICGVSSDVITRWRTEEDLPMHKRGNGWAVGSRPFLRWVEERAVKKAKQLGEVDANLLTHEQEQHRLTRAKADLAEVQAREKEGKMVPVEDVQQVVIAAIMHIRRAALDSPARLAADVAGETDRVVIKKIWRDELQRMLEEAERQVNVYVESVMSEDSLGGDDDQPQEESA